MTASGCLMPLGLCAEKAGCEPKLSDAAVAVKGSFFAFYAIVNCEQSLIFRTQQ